MSFHRVAKTSKHFEPQKTKSTKHDMSRSLRTKANVKLAEDKMEQLAAMDLCVLAHVPHHQEILRTELNFVN